MTRVSLDAKLLDFCDFLCNLCGDGRVDAERLFPHQGFTGKLEEYTSVGGLGHIRTIISFGRPDYAASPSLKRTNRATEMFSPSLAIAACTVWPMVTFGSRIEG